VTSTSTTTGSADDLLGCPMVGQPGHACGTITVDPGKLQPKADLVIHLTVTTLADGGGPARADGLEPLLAEWLAQLLPDHQIRVRPVIDLNAQTPSDSYETPSTMREALDHTIPWNHSVEATAGRTHPDNLGPLSRRVHRAKAHGGWQLQQPMPGIYFWQSPLGYCYLVTPSRTIDLGRPDTPRRCCEVDLAGWVPAQLGAPSRGRTRRIAADSAIP
jgi:hypothetical protein